MRIIIFRGFNNSYYIISEENAPKIPKEILNELLEKKHEVFNGNTEFLFSGGRHPEVEQIKNQITKPNLLNNLEEKGFLKVVL